MHYFRVEQMEFSRAGEAEGLAIVYLQSEPDIPILVGSSDDGDHPIYWLKGELVGKVGRLSRIAQRNAVIVPDVFVEVDPASVYQKPENRPLALSLYGSGIWLVAQMISDYPFDPEPQLLCANGGNVGDRYDFSRWRIVRETGDERKVLYTFEIPRG